MREMQFFLNEVILNEMSVINVMCYYLLQFFLRPLINIIVGKSTRRNLNNGTRNKRTRKYFFIQNEPYRIILHCKMDHTCSTNFTCNKCYNK